MPSTQVAKLSVALTADATSAGIVTLTSNASWIPGVKAVLSSSTEAPMEVIVAEQIGSTQLRLRSLTATAKYGFSDLSIYDLADAARLSRGTQVVAVMAPFDARDKA